MVLGISSKKNLHVFIFPMHSVSNFNKSLCFEYLWLLILPVSCQPICISQFLTSGNLRYKDDLHCNRLIAEALNPDGNISPVQVSCKLKQLGLKCARRKRLTSSGTGISAGEDTAEVVHGTSATGATNCASNEPEDSSYLKNS